MAALKNFGIGLLVLGLFSLVGGCCIGADLGHGDPIPMNEKKQGVQVFLGGAACMVVGAVIWYLGDRRKKTK
jgi:hypothetical protein